MLFYALRTVCRAGMIRADVEKEWLLSSEHLYFGHGPILCNSLKNFFFPSWGIVFKINSSVLCLLWEECLLGNSPECTKCVNMPICPRDAESWFLWDCAESILHNEGFENSIFPSFSWRARSIFLLHENLPLIKIWETLAGKESFPRRIKVKW